MPLPPWIYPQSPLQAIEAGANVGLQLRGQDIAQSEAGDRLKLAYAQLSQEENARNQAAKARMEMANATMALKSQQLTLLDKYRQQRVAEQQAALEQQKDIATMRLRPRLHFGTDGEVLAEQPDGSISQVRPPRTKPVTDTITEPVNPDQPFGAKVTRKVTPEEAAARLKAVQTATPPPASTGFSLFHPSTWGGGTPAPAKPAATAYATPDQVKDAYTAKKISYAQAAKILREQFGIQ